MLQASLNSFELLELDYGKEQLTGSDHASRENRNNKLTTIVNEAEGIMENKRKHQ